MSIFFGVLSLVGTGLAIWNAAHRDMENARFDVILGLLFSILMKLWA